MNILGVKIDNLDIEEVLKRVNGFLESQKQHYIVTPNPEFLIKAQEDQKFKEILNQADISIPDGVGLIFASWFLNQPIKKRIQGIDLMEKICEQSAQKNWPVFLMGGQQGVAEKAIKNLKERYPGLRIKSGYEQVWGQPEILFVALGAPKQEKWINDNLSGLPSVKLAVGVGGAFDFISGRVKRAPKLMRQGGLEWLWRFGRQPWRAKRIYNAVIKFPWLVMKSKR